jgi:hypothetical protein
MRADKGDAMFYKAGTIWILPLAGVLFLVNVLRADIPPATQPAVRPYLAAARVVSKLFQKDFDPYEAMEEPISRRYTLVRLKANPYQDSADGRVRFVLRITVDTETGELREVRGEYSKNEIELINQRRPSGTITAEEAIKIVADSLRHGGFHPALPPSRIDIDLVAGQYYVVRLPNRMPQAPRKAGDLGPDYFMRLVVDAKTGVILYSPMGDGDGVEVNPKRPDTEKEQK